MKALTQVSAILVGFVLLAVVIGGMFYFGGFSMQAKQQEAETLSSAFLQEFNRYDVEFDFNAKDGSDAQDSESDLDIDCFVWDASVQDDLDSTGGGDNKGYVDCSGAQPMVMTGEETVYTLSNKNFCTLNLYKFWQDSSFNAGDSETKLDDYLNLQAADIDPIDASGGTESIDGIPVKRTILCTVTEGATADNEDVVPFAFLFTVEPAKLPEQMASDINDGTTNFRIEYKYYSEAGAHSKLKISGDWEDDEGNSGDLDSSLDGLIDSSLTTATTVSYDGNIYVEIKEDGYAEPLVNPLATNNLEKAYLVMTPYGEDDGDESWVEYGNANLTGDVPYSSSNVATDQIIWQGSSACGVTLTDDSGTDAVKMGDEKIYEGSCFVSSSTTKDGITGIFDDDGELVIPFSIDEVKVDYDASTDGTNEQVDANSGSSPEDLFDVDMVGLESSTDLIAQTISG